MDWRPKSQVSFRRFGSGDKQVLGSEQRACWEQASSTKGSVVDEHGNARTGFLYCALGISKKVPLGLKVNSQSELNNQPSSPLQLSVFIV